MNQNAQPDHFTYLGITENVIQIQLNTTPERPVNAYLLTEKPITLIDTGHRQTKCFSMLEGALNSLGHRVDDIECIIYTHPHIDHLGGGLTINERNPQVRNIGFVGAVEPFEDQTRFNRELIRAALHFLDTRGVGAPLSCLEQAREFFVDYLSVTEEAGISLTSFVQEGMVVKAGGVELEVLYTPSHTPWDISLYERRHGLLFSGDFLLEKAIPLFSYVTHSDFDQCVSSLERAGKLELTTVLPGHGNPINKPNQLISKWKKELHRRGEKITIMLKQGIGSLPEIACSFVGESTQDFYTWYRCLGFVDTYLMKLVREGKAEQLWKGGGIHYAWKG